MAELIKIRVVNDPVSVVTGNTSTTGAVNLGGVGLFAQKNGTLLEFKGLVAGAYIALTPSSTGISISSLTPPFSGVTNAEFDTYTGATQTRLNGIENNVTYLSGQTALKLNKSAFNVYSASTLTNINSRLLTSSFSTYSGATATAINSKLATSAFNTYSASTLTNINNRLLKSAFNTYSGLTQTAINAKLSTSVFNTYSASTLTNINTRLLTSAFNTYSGITATAIGNRLLTSAFNTYSGATATAINSKLATSAFNTYSGLTKSDINSRLLSSTFATYSGTSAPILNSAVTGGTSLGNVAIFADKLGRKLRFKGLIAGSNITLSPSSSGITISSSGGGGGPTTGVTHAEFNAYTGATNTRLNGIENNIVYLSGQTALKLSKTAFNIYSASTLTNINSRLLTSAFNTYSGLTATAINSKLATSAFNTYSASTLTNINSRLLTSAFNTYSGLTATAIGNRLLTSAFNTYSGLTNTRLVGIENNITYLSGQTALKLSVGAFNTYSGATLTNINSRLLTSNFNTYSGLTATAIGNRLLTSAFNTYSGATASAINSKLSTSAFNTYSGLTATAIGNRLLTSAFNTYSGLTLTSINSKLATSAFNTYSGATATRLGLLETNYISGLTNLGSGQAIYTSVSAHKAQVKSLKARGGMAVSGTTNDITYYFTGSTVAYMPVDANITGRTTTTTIDAGYAGKMIECNGTFTLTLPNGMNTGMQINIINVGTGVITIAASTTLQSKFSNTKLSAQYAAATAYHAGSNVWRLFGDLNA